MDFDYFFEEQSEQFVFIRVPMMLMTDERFNGISSDAKILYGLLLDRTVLSARNHWVDKLGRVYIIYTLAGIQKSPHCADKKATKLLCELESIGLIERRKQGQGRPALIYVKNFIPASNVRVKTRQKYDVIILILIILSITRLILSYQERDAMTKRGNCTASILTIS